MAIYEFYRIICFLDLAIVFKNAREVSSFAKRGMGGGETGKYIDFTSSNIITYLKATHV